jgi:hypothetical protein
MNHLSIQDVYGLSLFNLQFYDSDAKPASFIQSTNIFDDYNLLFVDNQPLILTGSSNNTSAVIASQFVSSNGLRYLTHKISALSIIYGLPTGTGNF